MAPMPSTVMRRVTSRDIDVEECDLVVSAGEHDIGELRPLGLHVPALSMNRSASRCGSVVADSSFAIDLAGLGVGQEEVDAEQVEFAQVGDVRPLGESWGAMLIEPVSRSRARRRVASRARSESG